MRVERLLEEIRASRRAGEADPGENSFGGDSSEPTSSSSERRKVARLMEEALQAIREGKS
jgi:hypothetical protein